MADIEERLLRKNVPGRYSSWNDREGDTDPRREEDEYDDGYGGIGGGGDVNGDDDNYRSGWGSGDEPNECPVGSMGESRGAGPYTSDQRCVSEEGVFSTDRLPRGGNTGVRGVVSDYRASRVEERRRLESDRIEQERAWLRAAHRGGRMRPGEISWSLSASNAAGRSSRYDDGESNSESDDGGGGRDCCDDEADAFPRRKHRELSQRIISRGCVSEVTKFEFVDAVDSAPAGTILAVHIYDPSVRVCVRFGGVLDEAAPLFSNVRFVCLLASEAGLDLDQAGYPSLSLYMGGELVHNLTPATERLPSNYDAEDLRELLEECGAVSTVALTGGRRGKVSKCRDSVGDSAIRSKGTPAVVPAVDYDSDDAELDEFCKDFVPST